jgi:hypothetical protein
MLEQEPRLEPMTLFEYLQEQYPGYYDSQLRTLQRRVEQWKAAHGKPKEVMFQMRHAPGEMGLSDFTQLKGMTITVKGHPFAHLLYHYRLAFSGWQYVQVIQGGESFVGLSNGLQNALAACGGVPQTHRTDSLSAAYRNTGGRNPKLTRMYEEVCAHYRLQPTRNNLGVAHENGAIEASHGHFKRRLCQALYRRGSFEFASVAAYQAFIEQVIVVTLQPGQAPMQLPPLPGAEEEATAIARLFKVQAIIGNQATKTNILSQLSQAKIIHLATHGLLEYGQGEGSQDLDIPGAIALYQFLKVER